MDVGMVLYDEKLSAVLVFTFANLWTLLMTFKGMKKLKALKKTLSKDQ
jgi:hypothetical protein